MVRGKTLKTIIEEALFYDESGCDILSKARKLFRSEEFKKQFKDPLDKRRVKGIFKQINKSITTSFESYKRYAKIDKSTKIKVYEEVIFGIANAIHTTDYFYAKDKNNEIKNGLQKLIDNVIVKKPKYKKNIDNFIFGLKIAKNLQPSNSNFLKNIILPNLKSIKGLSFHKKKYYYMRFIRETIFFVCVATFLCEEIKNEKSLSQEEKDSLYNEVEKERSKREELKNKFQISSVSNQQIQEIATIRNESSNRNELFTNVGQSLSATRSRESEKRNSPTVRRSSSVENKDSSLKKSQNSFNDEIEYRLENTPLLKISQFPLDIKILDKMWLTSFLEGSCFNEEVGDGRAGILSLGNLQNLPDNEIGGGLLLSLDNNHLVNDHDGNIDNREPPANTGNKRRNQRRGSGSLFG